MAENNFLDGFWQLPAISRTLTAAAVTLSLGVHLKLLPAALFIHHPSYLWSIPPQIWRPVTSFLITGGGLGLLFDSYFLYHYLSQLEIGHPRFPRKADLVWYLIFVSGVILRIFSTTVTVPGNEEEYPCTSDRPIIRKIRTINYFADLPFYTFLSALILAMAYTVTQDQRGMKATFYVITVPAQLTPLCMIGINLLFPGGAMNMLLQLEGLVAAHLYDFLSRLWPQFGGGPNVLATPPFLHRLLRTPRVLNRSFGTAVRPTGSASGSSTGASTGPLPDAWKTRGAGQRLG